MSGVIRTVPCGCESGQPCTPATRCAITTAVHIQREDDEAEMERLREDHEAELAALRERAERAEAALLRKGYRMSCDIPACNCGDQWTHGGHAEMRLTEIREALEQAGARRNGETLLADVVHIAARAERATTIEAELAALRADAEIGQRWNRDSSLETWFPYTAEELTRLRAELVAAREDAERYRVARAKVCIVGDAFHVINLRPTYVAPDAAIEFDAAIDAARGES